MMEEELDVLRRLAAERGRLLGELGVRAEDQKWIGQEARTVASLVVAGRRRSPLSRFLYRFARRAARTAR